MVPFQIGGRTLVVSATTTSQAVDLRGSQPQIEIQNAGPGTVFVVAGEDPSDGMLTAAGVSGGQCDYPILAGQSKVITKGATRRLAVVSDSAATVYVTHGAGF